MIPRLRAVEDRPGRSAGAITTSADELIAWPWMNQWSILPRAPSTTDI
jgi:hypothetical protein